MVDRAAPGYTKEKLPASIGGTLAMTTTTEFPRDSWAHSYGRAHLEADDAIASVWYLKDAPDREIRLIEVNDQSVDRTDEGLEPVWFKISVGNPDEHRLYVLDVTPDQWVRIKDEKLNLPEGWSLDASEEIKR
jgi:hypothetical protein